MEQKLLHVEGTVENVLFKNESNGYAVLDLDAGGELITVRATTIPTAASVHSSGRNTANASSPTLW